MRRIFGAIAIAAVGPVAIAASGPIVDRRPVLVSPKAEAASAGPPCLYCPPIPPPGVLSQVRVEALTYMSDGLQIKGYLAVPKRPGRFPCVIFNRGGNPTFAVLTDDRAIAILGTIASWGYVAIASQYRGAGGSEGHDELGGADVDDVLNLIPVLELVANADPARIGMYGASRGGMMTYLALTRTDRVRTAVIVSGSTDMAEAVRGRPEMVSNVYEKLIPGYSADPVEAIRQRSAVRWADKLPATVPLLLIYGSADGRISPTEAFDMARALYMAQRPMRLVLYEGGSHGVPEFAAQRDALIHAWLDDYLRDGRKWPDLKPRN